MKFKDKISNTLKSIKNSYKRFPITIGLSIFLVIMLIVLSEIGGSITENTRSIYRRVNAIIALGIPLSLCIKLFFHRKKDYKKLYEVLAYIVGMILLLLYYFFLLKDFNMVSIYRYVGVSMFLYLAFAYIPYIDRKENYEFYIIKVFSNFFLTIIYSLVLYLGIAAIFFTINQLFNTNIVGKYFYYVFLIISGVFALSLFLSKLPKSDEEFVKGEYPMSLKVLLLYIVIPLLTIYSVILYLYFFKIILTKNWPEGLVSHLVLWYSAFSIAVIFFITPIINENKLANLFKTWFPRFIIPILIMMFISIAIRVKAYGITENRYFGIALGLWVMATMIYFIFKKKPKNIIIPISLSIIVLNSVIGPLSSFSISKNNQNKRLQSLLVENNMLEDKKLKKPTNNIAEKDKMKISEILDYFESSHSLEEVKYFPKTFKIKDMENLLGFSYTEKDIDRRDYFYYYYDNEGKTIDIKEYDYFLESYSIMDQIKLDNNTIIINDESRFKLKTIENEKLIYSANIKEFAEEIVEKNKTLRDDNLLDMDELTIVDENDKVKIKIIFKNINIKNIEGEKPIIEDLAYNVLIKIK